MTNCRAEPLRDGDPVRLISPLEPLPPVAVSESISPIAQLLNTAHNQRTRGDCISTALRASAATAVCRNSRCSHCCYRNSRCSQKFHCRGFQEVAAIGSATAGPTRARSPGAGRTEARIAGARSPAPGSPRARSPATARPFPPEFPLPDAPLPEILEPEVPLPLLAVILLAENPELPLPHPIK